MKVPSILKSFANTSYSKLAPNIGDMLLITGAIGWILSSAAQVTAIAINSKIPKEQKKFLVPQEIADAAVNILSFWLVTRGCQRLGEKFVKNGRIITKDIKNFLIQQGHESEICKKDFNMTKIIESDKVVKEKFNNLFDGVAFISSTIGSIISCNLITPYLRNIFAASKQKASIAEEKSHLTPIDRPVLPMQNKFLLKPMNTVNSGMKI